MRYSDELIQQIKEANNIVDIVSEYVTLKRKGSTHFGLCPFHREKSPSFAVSEIKGVYHCFGCNKGGTVIQFIQEIERLSFQEALKNLADRVNITLPVAEDPMQIRREKEREKAFKLNKEAAEYFVRSLFGKDEYAKRAQKYVLERKLSAETAKEFWIGYSKMGLYEYLKSKGYTDQEILSVGLIYRRDDGRYVDRYINRLMFTLKDERGRVIGFTGRKLDDKLDVAKYVNSNENIVYSKGRTMYGIDIAKKYSQEEIIVVEGNMDAISLHQRGIKNVVASMGVALTEQQARLLMKYSKKIKIAYDSDSAGEEGALRGLDILRKLGADVRVVIYEGAKDPDEYILKYGKDKFLERVRKSISLVEFKLAVKSKKYNLNNTAEKANFLEEAVKILSQIENKIEQEIYISTLSDKYEISKGVIEYELSKHLRKEEGKIDIQKFEENKIKSITNKEIENKKRKISELAYREECLLICALLEDIEYRKKVSNGTISTSVIYEEINKKIAEKIIENSDQGNEQLLNILFEDQQLAGRITEIQTLELVKGDISKEKLARISKVFKLRELNEIKNELILQLTQNSEVSEMALDIEMKKELEKEYAQILEKINELNRMKI